MPVLNAIAKEEVDVTVELCVELVNFIADFVVKNKVLMLTSMKEPVERRVFYVDRGRMWASGKASVAEGDKQWHESVSFLEKLLDSVLSDR